MPTDGPGRAGRPVACGPKGRPPRLLLTDADLRESVLIDTDFTGANLTNADFTGATFREVRGLDSATTTGARGLDQSAP